MLLHHGEETHQVRTLLDTGCSVALISTDTVERLRITKKEHKQQRAMETYMGEKVKGAGQYYTAPMLLQHRKHYSVGKFEISPMDSEVDIFLPFSWIVVHPPQGTWTNQEIRFNSTTCLAKCTRFETNKFPLTWDDSVATDPATHLLGYVASVSEKDPRELVPPEFRQYVGIMGKEAADALPEHRPYDCKIDLQEGSTAPWGPIYPLSENELTTLREWLKEMERTGKI